MVANTIEMNDLKLKIEEILNYEENALELVEGLIVGQNFSLNDLEELREMVHNKNLFKKFITPIDLEKLLENSYLKDINFEYSKNNRIFLANSRKIRKNDIVYTDVCSRDDNFMPLRKWGYLKQDILLPTICENDTTISWMTVEPFEINTFESFRKSAKGSILLGGCGLGYIAYMLSLKDEVSSITIVEKSEYVIDLFKTSILPQFKYKNKIKIIEGDIIEYLKIKDLSEFDEINIDVWRDVIDMIYIYLEALVVEHDNPNIKFSYWLEENLRYQIGKSILKAFIGIDENDNIFDIIGKYILDNATINTQEDLLNLIKLEEMRNILYTWYIDNVELTDKLREKTTSHLEKFLKMNKTE